MSSGQFKNANPKHIKRGYSHLCNRLEEKWLVDVTKALLFGLAPQ